MSHSFSSCDFIAGWAGGMVGLFVGHPLDTIKVRQQIIPGGGKILTLIKSTYLTEGVGGFFKGLSYPMLGCGIYNAVIFGVYGNVLRWLQDRSNSNARKMCCEKDPPYAEWHTDVFIAGSLAGVGSVLYSCPLEVIKIKLQSQTAILPRQPSSVCKKLCKKELFYSGPLDALVQIYKNYGVYGGLYKGMWIMMWRDVPTFGLYMLTYEHVLCLFKKKGDRSSETSITSQLVAGGIAGVMSWATVSPFDVLKSKIQADDFGRPVYRGMMHCLRTTLHQDGIRALFLGLSLSILRAFPVNSATFVGYEFVIKICEKCGYYKEGCFKPS